MNMQFDQIKGLIIDAQLGEISSIDLIGSGYVSLAYKVSGSMGEFIALTPKPDCVEQPDYVYYFSVLKTLEAMNYEFAPKAIYVNLNQSVIVMTYVPGQSLSWADDSSEQVQNKLSKS